MDDDHHRPTNPNRLLVVDDEPAIRELFRDVAEELGYLVQEAGGRGEFVDSVAPFCPSVIVLDLTLPDTDGVELIRELAARQCSSAILLVSGQDSRVLATTQRLGRMAGLTMHGTLQKPVTIAEITDALTGLLAEPPATTP